MRSDVGYHLGCVDCDVASVHSDPNILAICLRSGMTAVCPCLPLWVHFDVISTNNYAIIPYIPDTFVLMFWVCWLWCHICSQWRNLYNTGVVTWQERAVGCHLGFVDYDVIFARNDAFLYNTGVSTRQERAVGCHPGCADCHRRLHPHQRLVPGRQVTWGDAVRRHRCCGSCPFLFVSNVRSPPDPDSKHWFTTFFLWRKVPESDARCVHRIQTATPLTWSF